MSPKHEILLNVQAAPQGKKRPGVVSKYFCLATCTQGPGALSHLAAPVRRLGPCFLKGADSGFSVMSVDALPLHSGYTFIH